MKKAIASILAVIYLSTSMGATVHWHYCMGRLVGWGLVDHESKDCMSCGMAKALPRDGCSVGMKNCCHDEHKHIQNDRAQKPAHGWETWSLSPVLAVLPCQGWNQPVLATIALARPVANGPPLTQKVPVFLRNCNFRI
ncbi:MAG TPA: hypothetical protein VGS79_20450 [Puia sp.]|nr:hypothetical protein [Puia sp.]